MKALYILINAVSVIVSFGLLAISWMPMLFCDSGTSSDCYRSFAIIAGGPIISIILVISSAIYLFGDLKNNGPKPITGKVIVFSLIALLFALLVPVLSTIL